MELPRRVIALCDTLRETFQLHAQRFPEPFFQRLQREIGTVRRAVELQSREAPPVFARVKAGEVECPHCHRVLQFGRGKAIGTWDRRRRTLTCPCGACYTIGMLLYPRRRKGSFRIGILAQDQVPTPEQRVQLLSGYHLPLSRATGSRQRPRRTNIVMAEGCLCEPGLWRQGSHPQCPVHSRPARATEGPHPPGW